MRESVAKANKDATVPKNFARLYCEACGIRLEDFPYGEPDEDQMAKILEVLYTLTPREEKVLRMRYGLDSGQLMVLREIAPALNVHHQRVGQIESKALRKLRHPARIKQLKGVFDPSILTTPTPEEAPSTTADIPTEVIDEWDGVSIDQLQLSISPSYALGSVHIFTIGQLLQWTEGELAKLRDLNKHGLNEIICELRVYNLHLAEERATRPDLPLPEGMQDISIKDLGLSTRTYNILVRAKIHSLGEIAQLTRADAANLRNMGEISLQELTDVLAKYGLSFAHDHALDIIMADDLADVLIEDLGLSTRAFNALHRANISNLAQLTEMSFSDLAHVRNLGERSLRDITDTLAYYGLALKPD